MVTNIAVAARNKETKDMRERVVLYAGIGSELAQFDLDVTNAALIRRASVHLPAGVQYAWPHASRQYLYVASSDRGPGRASASTGNTHHLSAFRIDNATGALEPHGRSVQLPHRPIHLTTDVPSTHALIAYCDPSNFSVHCINSDGTIGSQVEQPGPVDTGIYAHQIRVAPSNAMAILATRGHDAADGMPEEPGALKVFNYQDGALSTEVSIAPAGGYGFGPRHLDFHPLQPWVYISLERQHQLCLYTMEGDALSSAALYSKDTLAEPDNVRPRQLAGTVHVHPNGRFVYGAERADMSIAADGVQVYGGGENTILVYAINQRSGEPTLIQRMPTRGLHPRTFAIDPSGRILIAANKSPITVREDGALRTVPASLDLFRIGADGTLTYIRKYDINVGNGSLFWMGMIGL